MVGSTTLRQAPKMKIPKLNKVNVVAMPKSALSKGWANQNFGQPIKIPKINVRNNGFK